MFVEVVNMVPHSLSGEDQMDSEPNITVNPADPRHIAASAFTPDPMSSGSGPIYVSTDEGKSWHLNVVLPGGNMTNDITVRFASHSNALYAGILEDGTLDMNILKKANFIAPGLMVLLVNRSDIDQPYIQAHTHAGSDRVYVGNNDFNVTPQTATVDLSQDANVPAAPFVLDHIETRPTSGQDGPPTRPAIHRDGTIYAAYCGWRSISGGNHITDIVVARDDHWAAGLPKFQDLVDPIDLLPGIRVATGVPIPFVLGSFLGNQRSAGSGLALAVDPTDSNKVYLAYASGTSAANYSLHLRRSIDRGLTWSGDLRTILQAMNPTLAINDHGEVGFFFQKLHNPGSGNHWQNQIEISHDGFATWTNVILADVNGPGPTVNPNNPIGDYAGLVTVGRTFYGIFSGNNTPNLANFPHGVKYQRRANFATKQLLDLSGTPVAPSIDPFFYRIHWHEEEKHHHEHAAAHEPEKDLHFGRLEVKGLKYEKLEIKELNLHLADPRPHVHRHGGHDESAIVRLIGEEIEEIGRRMADHHGEE